MLQAIQLPSPDILSLNFSLTVSDIFLAVVLSAKL
jgi:hypothetical protein